MRRSPGGNFGIIHDALMMLNIYIYIYIIFSCSRLIFHAGWHRFCLIPDSYDFNDNLWNLFGSLPFWNMRIWWEENQVTSLLFEFIQARMGNFTLTFKFSTKTMASHLFALGKLSKSAHVRWDVSNNLAPAAPQPSFLQSLIKDEFLHHWINGIGWKNVSAFLHVRIWL